MAAPWWMCFCFHSLHLHRTTAVMFTSTEFFWVGMIWRTSSVLQVHVHYQYQQRSIQWASVLSPCMGLPHQLMCRLDTQVEKALRWRRQTQSFLLLLLFLPSSWLWIHHDYEFIMSMDSTYVETRRFQWDISPQTHCLLILSVCH